MRTLVLGTLLAIMPFGGIRVICLDLPTDVSRSSAPADRRSDCERLCPLHRPSDTPSLTAGTPSSTESDSECGLSADGSSLSVSATIAVLRPQEPRQVPLVVSAVWADSPRFYLEPALAHLGPPPKPQAL